jgi:hypothetical protein
MQRFLNISTQDLQNSTSFSADFLAIFINKQDEIYLGVHKIHGASLRLCLRYYAKHFFSLATHGRSLGARIGRS